MLPICCAEYLKGIWQPAALPVPTAGSRDMGAASSSCLDWWSVRRNGVQPIFLQLCKLCNMASNKDLILLANGLDINWASKWEPIKYILCQSSNFSKLLYKRKARNKPGSATVKILTSWTLVNTNLSFSNTGALQQEQSLLWDVLAFSSWTKAIPMVSSSSNTRLCNSVGMRGNSRSSSRLVAIKSSW